MARTTGCSNWARLFLTKTFFGRLSWLLLISALALPLEAGPRDFTGKTLLQAARALAKAEHLHIILDGPDRALTAAVFPANASVEDVLRALANQSGTTYARRGHTHFLISAAAAQAMDRAPFSLVRFRDRLVCPTIVADTTIVPAPLQSWCDLPTNLVVLQGPDDLKQEAIRRLEGELPGLTSLQAVLTLRETATASAAIHVQWSALPDRPTRMVFEKGLGLTSLRAFTAVFVPGASQTWQLHWQARTNLAAPQSNAQGRQRIFPGQDLELTSSALPFPFFATLRFSAAAPPPLSPASAPLVADPATGPFSAYDFSQVPGEDILKALAPDGYLCCDSSCRRPLSFFGFGPELYAEEALNLLAKARGLVVRKRGFYWIVGHPDWVHDAIDSSDFLTRRLQFTRALDLEPRLQSVFRTLQPHNRVRADERVNLLVIDGAFAGVELAKQFVELADRPEESWAFALESAGTAGTAAWASQRGENLTGRPWALTHVTAPASFSLALTAHRIAPSDQLIADIAWAADTGNGQTTAFSGSFIPSAASLTTLVSWDGPAAASLSFRLLERHLPTGPIPPSSQSSFDTDVEGNDADQAFDTSF